MLYEIRRKVKTQARAHTVQVVGAIVVRMLPLVGLGLHDSLEGRLLRLGLPNLLEDAVDLGSDVDGVPAAEDGEDMATEEGDEASVAVDDARVNLANISIARGGVRLGGVGRGDVVVVPRRGGSDDVLGVVEVRLADLAGVVDVRLKVVRVDLVGDTLVVSPLRVDVLGVICSGLVEVGRGEDAGSALTMTKLREDVGVVEGSALLEVGLGERAGSMVVRPYAGRDGLDSRFDLVQVGLGVLVVRLRLAVGKVDDALSSLGGGVEGLADAVLASGVIAADEGVNAGKVKQAEGPEE
jgi:hypothetical protein